MVRQAMPEFSCKKNVITLCDSWYVKKDLVCVVDEYKNLDLIGNARSDSVMYDLPPQPTGKRGQPATHGKMLYAFRWPIEVSYYEQKTFWSLCSYMVRSRKGIEMLVNLIHISYCAMKLLPYQDEAFFKYQTESVQEFRFAPNEQIRQQIFYSIFVEKVETCIIGDSLPLIEINFNDLLKQHTSISSLTIRSISFKMFAFLCKIFLYYTFCRYE